MALPSSPVSSSVAPSPRTLNDLLVPLLRVVTGGWTPDRLRPWLEAFDVAPGGTAKYGERPIDLVTLAVGSRDAALLNAVLDVPAFCPMEHRRDRATLGVDEPASVDRVRRLQARHGLDPFNGGLDFAGVMPDAPWFGLLEKRIEVAARADGMGLPPEDPLRQVPDDQRRSYEAQNTMHQRALGGMGYPDAYRRCGGTNLVGLAVMMGWPEGVQVLLDHGVHPYARVGKAAVFSSPLLLAGYFGEAVCAAVLLLHPSFKPSARYGFDEEAVTQRRSRPDDRGTPWEHRMEHGGLDLVFVLEQPAMLADPALQAALAQRLTPAVVRRLMKPADGLPVAVRPALEQVVLRQTMASLGPTAAPTRSRSRL